MSTNTENNLDFNFSGCPGWSPNIEVSCMKKQHEKASKAISYIAGEISSQKFVQARTSFEDAYTAYYAVNSVNNHNNNNVLKQKLLDTAKSLNAEVKIFAPLASQIKTYKQELDKLYTKNEILPADYQRLNNKLSEVSKQSLEEIKTMLKSFSKEIENAHEDWQQENGDVYIPDQENEKNFKTENTEVSGAYTQQEDTLG